MLLRGLQDIYSSTVPQLCLGKFLINQASLKNGYLYRRKLSWMDPSPLEEESLLFSHALVYLHIRTTPSYPNMDLQEMKPGLSIKFYWIMKLVFPSDLVS